MVRQEARESLNKKIKEVEERDEEVSPPRTLSEALTSLLKKNRSTVTALITAVAALTIGYWQFVYKPTHVGPDEVVEYAGRVIDYSTQKAIKGAKITVDLPGVPQVYYTDSDGVFYLKVPKSASIVRLRVEEEGYLPFDMNVSISRTGVEDIRLARVETEPSPENIGLTYGHNPSLDEVRSDLERIRHLSIIFNSNCNKSVRGAVVKVNGGQLDGKDIKDLLENAVGPRANVKLSVKPIKEGESYEIVCGK